jgi:ABC-type glycerol-3-phosphate transport system substrate-binding protein
MKKWFLRALGSIVLASTVLLSGCDFSSLADLIPQKQTVSVGSATAIPANAGSASGATANAPTTPQTTGTALPASSLPAASSVPAANTGTETPGGPQVLTIWVPPQYDPNNGTRAGSILQNRLTAFTQAHPGVEIRVRVKAESGTGGLLDSLSAASVAAPGALPSLVALSRSDLETAALKGLIYSLDGLTQFKDDPDWYDFAKEMAMIQGSTFGLPFGGDALLLMYRPEKIGTPSSDWRTVLALGQPVAFPADDSQALVTLDLYRSAGGAIEDNQHRPALESQALEQVLQFYLDGARNGSFPAWLSQYQTDGQTWEAFREGRANLMIGWSSRYLAELPADVNAVPLPSLGSSDYTMATGWMWAVSDPSPQRQALSAELADFLVQSEPLAAWTAAAGMLPTRPTALAAWSNQSLKATLSRVVLSAKMIPANDLTTSLGPTLHDATIQIVKNQADPIQVAEMAVEKLTKP